MSNKPIATRPLSDDENLLREKFYEHITAQSDLIDKVSERLITLELGIPGLYATALKLVNSDQAVVVPNGALYITFACWMLALLLTLAALIPRNWVVDPAILRQDPQKMSQALGIEDFFSKSAQHKRGLVIASGIFFFAGIFSAIFTI